ncbi:MAG TPA: hypothetical protein VGK24_09595 [Candidatus Angelobacter sp.]
MTSFLKLLAYWKRFKVGVVDVCEHGIAATGWCEECQQRLG